MLLLAILKKSRIFPNNQSCFRNLFFCNVLRIITNSVEFYSELATFITFLKNRVFSEKPIHFFKKNTHFSKVLRFCTFSVALYCSFATSGNLKKSRVFSKTQSIFCQKKTNSWTLWGILQNWLLSASYWLLSAICKNTQIYFFEKPIFFSQEEAILSTFSEIVLNQLHPTTNFLSLAVFKKVNLFQKIHIFYIKKPNFEHFEKFFHSVAMYNKFATYSNFSLKKVFVRNEPIYVFQSP